MGGTSASAPTFAGVIALVNNARLAAGKPVLGKEILKKMFLRLLTAGYPRFS